MRWTAAIVLAFLYWFTPAFEEAPPPPDPPNWNAAWAAAEAERLAEQD